MADKDPSRRVALVKIKKTVDKISLQCYIRQNEKCDAREKYSIKSFRELRDGATQRRRSRKYTRKQQAEPSRSRRSGFR